ncbi:hypothetical protein N7475_009342 [Penicillium sp. IBT 31633x]|nr:hypothetical protein N7475_009342 [Penicillium sp. IBT 31633x]
MPEQNPRVSPLRATVAKGRPLAHRPNRVAHLAAQPIRGHRWAGARRTSPKFGLASCSVVLGRVPAEVAYRAVVAKGRTEAGLAVVGGTVETVGGGIHWGWWGTGGGYG